MKKTVFLDLGNVILRVKKDIAFEKIAELCNRNITDIEKAIDWNLEQIYETGQISTDDYITELNKFNPDTQVFTFENLCAIWEQGFEKIESTINILPELSKKTNLFLLSNTNKIHFSAIEKRFKISKYFKDLFLSYQLKCRKPGSEIYLKALTLSAATAENTYFFDDLIENVAAAKNIGIDAQQYTDEKSFHQFLTKHSLI